MGLIIKKVQKEQFQNQILERYAMHKRDLPWRQTTDPYKIMVSECMLQQTQVPRVIMKFTRWMELWPTVVDLAQAERTMVLREWSGLGFNRRAINLHEACKKIVRDAYTLCGMTYDYDATRHSSQSEDNRQIAHDIMESLRVQVTKNMMDYAYLRTLPGIGEYTSNAILAFAYNQEVPVLDINIKRVLLHSFDLPPDTSVYDLQELALSLVPYGRSREWHNALMDYGSQVLHSRATGIRSAKQSAFKGSDREVRGWILKQLVGNTGVSNQGFLLNATDIVKDMGDKKIIFITSIQTQFPDKDVEKIIAGLVKEGMVTQGVVDGVVCISLSTK